MALELKEERIENGDFTACGDITTLLSVGKKEFFLNCKYCDYTCLTLDDFTKHIYDDHLQKFIEISKERKHTYQSRVHLKEEIYDVDCSDGSLEISEDDNFELTYFEKIEIDHTYDNNTCITEDLSSEEILSDRSMEEEAIEYEDANFELLGQTSDNAESDAEISANGSDTLWKKQFDVRYKKFVLEFIEAYRSLPALWNSKLKIYFDRSFKKEQYEILLKKFKEKYPKATREDVKTKIAGLRSVYKRELNRIGPSGISSLYYFDAMSFLLPVIPGCDSTKSNVQVPTDMDCEKYTRKDSVLNDGQFIELAKLYQIHDCLWDEKVIAYRFANRRREAVDNILKELNGKFLLDLDKSTLEKEILKLRRVCSSEKKEKLKCKRNNTTYKQICPYYEHISFLEIDVNPFECDICGKLQTNLGRHKTHVASHDNSLPFKCHICDHGFQLASNLGVHLRRHVQDFVYNCKVCRKQCATSSELKYHMRFHTGEKPYFCEHCGKNFRVYADLRKHKQYHEKRPRHKCEICSRAFYNKWNVNEHMKVHSNKRDQICSVCFKAFKTLKQLRQHEHIHDLEKKFACKICGKRFSQPAGASCHMKSHGTPSAAIEARDFDSNSSTGEYYEVGEFEASASR